MKNHEEPSVFQWFSCFSGRPRVTWKLETPARRAPFKGPLSCFLAQVWAFMLILKIQIFQVADALPNLTPDVISDPVGFVLQLRVMF